MGCVSRAASFLSVDLFEKEGEELDDKGHGRWLLSGLRRLVSGLRVQGESQFSSGTKSETVGEGLLIFIRLYLCTVGLIRWVDFKTEKWVCGLGENLEGLDRVDVARRQNTAARQSLPC